MRILRGEGRGGRGEVIKGRGGTLNGRRGGCVNAEGCKNNELADLGEFEKKGWVWGGGTVRLGARNKLVWGVCRGSGGGGGGQRD